MTRVRKIILLTLAVPPALLAIVFARAGVALSRVAGHLAERAMKQKQVGRKT